MYWFYTYIFLYINFYSVLILWWIARCKGGLLYIFDNVPVKHEEVYWTSQRGYYDLELNSRLFPEVTWENSPKKVVFKLL